MSFLAAAIQATRQQLTDRFVPRDRLDRYALYEPFAKRPGLAADLDPGTVNQAANRLLVVANKDFVLSGTNAATANSVLAAGGGATLTTAGANNDQAIVSPLTTVNSVDASQWNKADWNSSQSAEFRCRITMPATITSMRIKAGLCLTAALDGTTDADQVYFVYDTSLSSSPGQWQIGSSIASTNATSPIGASAIPASTVTASTSYDLAIVIDSSRSATLYLNGFRAGGVGPLTANKTFIPVIGVQALTGSARSLTLRDVLCSRLSVA